MSNVRALAMQTTGFLVRHAPAGAREWAEALASEVQYIDGDWRALAWALSGLQVLFIQPPAPLRTLAELNVAAQKHADLRRKQLNRGWLDRNLAWLAQLISSVCTVLFIRRFQPGGDRLGYAMILLGLTTSAIANYNGSLPVVPGRENGQAVILFYKRELTRVAEMSSLKFWSLPVCMLLVFAGYELLMPLRWEKLLALIILVPVLLFLVHQRKNRRRIAQIDALLATTGVD